MPEYMEAKDIDNSYLAILMQPKHIAMRILWLICFLIMLVSCIYIVYLMLADFLTFSSYNLVSVTHTSSYTLPAITICNINLLNKTLMVDTKVKDIPGQDPTDERVVYDVYKKMESSFSARGGSATIDFTEWEGINEWDIWRRFAWDINSTVIYELMTFAKEKVDPETSSMKTEYTSMGRCLEINDDSGMVQRLDGATGGLVIVLDAMVQHYLDSTDSEGFYVIIRQPNETVLHQEFSFLVSAGQEVHVSLDTNEVTRLSSPYGTCVNTTDMFNEHAVKEDDVISLKECFLEQWLWMYMYENSCRCLPWYFNERYFVNNRSEKYYPGLNETLLTYFTTGLPEPKQIKFNATCTYTEDGYYKDGLLETKSDVSAIADCDTLCRATNSCVVYMYSTATNDVLSAKECKVYSDSSKLVYPALDYSISGLTRGEVNCTGGPLEECNADVETRCKNIVIDNLMSNEKQSQPAQCVEPCAYWEYKYRLSNAEYPALNYWNSYLNKTVSNYDEFPNAKFNLVKLVFFTEQMKTTTSVQTKAYEMQNFIAEFGGITDLFIGLSFFTVFQLLELLITVVVKRKETRGPTEKPVSDSTVMAMNSGQADHSI